MAVSFLTNEDKQEILDEVDQKIADNMPEVINGVDGKDGADGKDGTNGVNGKDGVSPTVTVSAITGGHRVTITDANGAKTFDVLDGVDGEDGADGKDGTNGTNGTDGKDGSNGADGFSPTVSVTEITGGHRVTIVDTNGTKSFDVMDGEDGADGTDGKDGSNGTNGEDGISPSVSVTTITGGHRVTIVDANGTKSFDVMDGADGEDGVDAGTITTEEKTFKVWGPNATTATGDDIVTENLSGYYDKNGVQQQTSTFGCAKIAISEGATVYAYNLYDFSAGYAIVFWDENENFISGIGTGDTTTRISGDQIVPSNARYVGITLLKSDSGMYAQITTKETIIVDSFSETETFDYVTLVGSQTNGYYDTNGVFQSTDSWKCTDFIKVSEGDTLAVKLTTYDTANAISYFDINHNYISGVVGDTWSWDTSVYPLDVSMSVPVGVYFIRVSVFVADYATDQYVTVKRSLMNGLRNEVNVLNVKPLNVLVLGDSYSETGRWVEAMRDVITINNLVNLGVTSATIRDRYGDRNTYPYTDRPTGTDNDGNKNTLACQIQKLKRLMNGTDLDNGESKIYASVSDYPDVIIIEGGMNDSADTDEKVETYYEQFLIAKTAYFKQSSSVSATQRTVYVKPSLDEIDRTCFAGAYRYLCEELIALFPNAQIFITTASHMSYFTYDPNTTYGKIAEQQRKCAEIMSYSVIDWHAEGNLNTMMISLNGSGTESDPYTPVGGDNYTTDLLHPNANGAKRYGRLAGKVIMQKFLNLD